MLITKILQYHYYVHLIVPPLDKFNFSNNHVLFEGIHTQCNVYLQAINL